MKSAGKVKKASSFFFLVLRLIFRPVLFLMYRYKFDMKTSKGIKRPCLILSNHQTAFDQFAVGLGFKFGINYIASDTLFRYGLKSWLMKKLGRPIPISKGSSDLIAVRNIMSLIRSGGSVGIFPSGNRSFYGDECTIAPGIGKLAKRLKAPLVLVELSGGFNTKPRWSVKPNKGKMRGRVARVIQLEDLAALSNDQVDGIIRKELGFNEFEFNQKAGIAYRGKRKAEYLESVLFYCPQCASMTGLCSQGCDFFCRHCGARVTVNRMGFFDKICLAEKIPGTILEWSQKQIQFIKTFDFSGYQNTPVFSDSNITFSAAERAKKENLIGTGSIKFFTDRLDICGTLFPFTETTMAVQGVRKLTMYHKEQVYAVEAPDRTNLMKYMVCGYFLRNKLLNINEEFYGY